jgi:hypothetical protein
MLAPSRRRFPCVLGLIALVAIVAGAVRGWTQEPANERERSVSKSIPFIDRASSCEQCHSVPTRYNAEDVICRMNESAIWAKSDKHRLAFSVLEGPRAEQMGKRLAIDVRTDKACLNCHSVAQAIWPPDATFTADTANANRDALRQEGVGCVACHGAKREWIRDHTDFDNPQWRALSRREKEQRFGMVDLWDPATRARKCLSCHVGSVADDRVLTHAMYAAGHPPLPGIEVFTFSKAMPNHWEFLSEKVDRLSSKKPPVQESLKRTLPLAPDRLDHTELVAVSGVAVLRATLGLFADQAAKDGFVERPKTAWPDYARYDCQACHHDLKTPSWRQERGYTAAPGRPPLPDWPAVLVGVAIDAAGADRAAARHAEFERGLKDFHAALGVRPFGDKAHATESARKLIAWLDQMLGDLGAARADRALALRLLDRLARTTQTRLLDYDAARQVFWSYRVIYDEIEPKARPADPVVALLDRLDRRFGLSLPSPNVQEPIEKSLAQRLQSVAEFDPFAFQEACAELPGLTPVK